MRLFQTPEHAHPTVFGGDFFKVEVLEDEWVNSSKKWVFWFNEDLWAFKLWLSYDKYI